MPKEQKFGEPRFSHGHDCRVGPNKLGRYTLANQLGNGTEALSLETRNSH